MVKSKKQIPKANSFACENFYERLLKLKPEQSFCFNGRVIHPNPWPTNKEHVLQGKITLEYKSQVNCKTEDCYQLFDEKGKGLFIVSPRAEYISLNLSRHELTEPYVGLNSEGNLIKFFPSEMDDMSPPKLHGSSLRYPSPPSLPRSFRAGYM